MKTTRTTKPLTSDCYGKSFYTMTIEQLNELLNSMKIERKHNSFWNETVKFRKAHTATMLLLENLVSA